MKVNCKNYIGNSKFKINKFPTNVDLGLSDEEAEERLKEVRKKIAEIQDKMYAQNKYSVLVNLQGMDTSGKDSLIREVFKNFNVRGVQVSSFKVPTAKELQHDFLWRHTLALPEKGKFGVFNRTYYENVLVSRVHPQIVLNENNPYITKTSDIDDKFWDKRIQAMVDYENHLAANGMIIFKFFLHISKEEQRKRLLKRLETPKDQWKFSAGDLKERALWDKYQFCYEDMIQKSSHKVAPWYIIPSDNKKISRLLMAEIMLEKLEELKDVAYPLSEESKAQLEIYRKKLTEEN